MKRDAQISVQESACKTSHFFSTVYFNDIQFQVPGAALYREVSEAHF